MVINQYIESFRSCFAKFNSSYDKVAVIHKIVCISTKSTLEDVLTLNFNSFWAFGYFMSDLSTIITNIISWLMFKQIFIQQFRLLKILLHKYFWMVVRTFASFFAIPVHVIPTKFSNDVFIFTGFTKNTESHIIVWTALINVSELAMIAFRTLIFHKLLADFYIMTEVTFITVRATSLILKLITRFNFTSVMNIGTCLSAFTMDELFTDSVFSQLMRIWNDWLVLIVISCVIKFIIVPGTLSVVIKVLHLIFI